MASKRKRIGNVKAKAKRERSWQKNQAAKALRVEDQNRRAAYNREVGSTGKQRANEARKAGRIAVVSVHSSGAFDTETV